MKSHVHFAQGTVLTCYHVETVFRAKVTMTQAACDFWRRVYIYGRYHMPSQFFGLTIAGSGINAYQTAINTTANNIANVQTEGYSRQVSNSVASDPMRVYARYGSAGTGITTLSIKQVRNEYYDQKYWENQSSLGYYEDKLYYMTQIEDYFTDDDMTTGFVSLLNEYQNALDGVKDWDGSETSRQAFISSAQSLGVFFNHVSSELSSLQSGINDQIKTTVESINSIAQKMALLTKQINIIELQGGYANELRDQRNLLADQLNSIIPVEITEAPIKNSNDEDLYLGGTTYKVKYMGQMLVNSYDYREIECVSREVPVNQTDASGLYDLRWKDTGVSIRTTGDGTSGSLSALFEMRDGNNNTNFTGYLTKMEKGANGVVKAVFSAGDFNQEMTSVNNLNMPERGYITINNVNYEYDGFSFDTEMTEETLPDGSVQYHEKITSFKFNLVDADASKVEAAVGKASHIGETIDNMGVPYYMNQMSAFLRSFTEKFNTIQESGVDLDGKEMGAFFVAKNELDGTEIDFHTYSEYRDEYAADHSKNTHTYNIGGTQKDSTYYSLTADNFMVSYNSTSNPRHFATATEIENGVEKGDLLERMKNLYGDVEIYRGCKAKDFLQCIYDDVAVDKEETQTFVDNYKSIQGAIQTQRDSVSGVDQDEEALDLIKFQNAYNLNSKVIQILTEIYDRLILETGV